MTNKDVIIETLKNDNALLADLMIGYCRFLDGCHKCEICAFKEFDKIGQCGGSWSRFLIPWLDEESEV